MNNLNITGNQVNSGNLIVSSLSVSGTGNFNNASGTGI